MYAGALFIQQALHWDLYIAVVGLLAITAVYTVAGTWLFLMVPWILLSELIMRTQGTVHPPAHDWSPAFPNNWFCHEYG